MSAAIQVFEFDGATLHAYTFQGRPCWIAQDVGALLGYTRELVYRELKKRNPDPQDGSLNYQFLTEAKHKIMQRDMGKVAMLLRLSRDAEDFFAKLGFEYQKRPLQLGWG